VWFYSHTHTHTHTGKWTSQAERSSLRLLWLNQLHLMTKPAVCTKKTHDSRRLLSFDKMRRWEFTAFLLLVACLVFLVTGFLCIRRETPRRRVAVCFLTVFPCPPLLEFADSLDPYYDVFISADDEDRVCEDPRVLSIPGSEAENAGYWGSLLWHPHRACSRDKALYYFCQVRMDYEHVWMIEEDVFVPCVATLLDLDASHPNADLMSADHTQKPEGSWDDWHWPLVARQAQVGEPFASSMICAARLSRDLLHAVAVYARRHGQLFLDEALFNTLAMQAQLKVVTPPELSTVVYEREWRLEDLKATHLYHPVKDCYLQASWRSSLSSTLPKRPSPSSFEELRLEDLTQSRR